MRARRWMLLGVVLAGAAEASCSLDWSLDGTPDATAPVDGRAPDGGPFPDGSPAPDSGAAIPCRATGDCPANTFCHFPDHLCGTQGDGVCIAPRAGCTVADPYVCQCNPATSTTNECVANASGQDVSALGNCPPFPFEWVCAYVYCHTAPLQNYCVRSVDDAGETKYDCVNPAGCGTAGCSSCTVPGCTCTDLDASAGISVIDCG